jgi:hypothetical protein
MWDRLGADHRLEKVQNTTLQKAQVTKGFSRVQGEWVGQGTGDATYLLIPMRSEGGEKLASP